MMEMTLPQKTDGTRPPLFPKSRQITLIGANGSGKTRFMNELIKTFQNKAYILSAISAFYPEREESKLEGSIDMLYANAIKSSPYLKSGAVSELDKLGYMLFNDEFQSLLYSKTQRILGENHEPTPTKLDSLIAIWQQIFPNNQIIRQAGKWMFATDSGDDAISAIKLSQGEKAVLYYISAVLYAMPNAVIFIDSPTMFLHPSILNTVWNAIENLRPDCTFIYNTYDVAFVNSRTENVCIWVKSYNMQQNSWDYEILHGDNIGEELFIDLVGTRKPVLFIEGDAVHSIDAKLYPLVFPDYTVRPLGSCNKVIESTRTFNDLKHMHHLDSRGIVDRDRRTENEVDYLRNKNIMVPEVAEIENMFLIEGVIKTMARRRGKDPDKIFNAVKTAITKMFRSHLESQALLHVRHKVKHDVEYRIDARFNSISELEQHLRSLEEKLRPRETFNRLRAEFRQMLETNNYAGILRVFNHKPMLSESNVATLLDYRSKEQYIKGVLNVLKGNSKDAKQIRASIKHCFGLSLDDKPLKDTLNQNKQTN